MAVRCQFEANNEVGVFCKLTNKYCLVGLGASNNFYNIVEAELNDVIPVIHCSIAGTRIVGRTTVGNRHGLLVPFGTTDQELQHLRQNLPEDVAVKRVDEKLSALGNVIALNDYVALVHADLSKETEEALKEVLKVEVFRVSLGEHALIGSYATVTSQGCLVAAKTPVETQKEIASLLQVPVVAGTVNRGSELIGGGLCVNDWIAFTGLDTTAAELSVVESIFKLGNRAPTQIANDLRDSLIESML
ncbi:hypothetical protein FO519_006697 [Halicephalobus sp. NKZ332]|nr:hypothetical protein FO519_006697 [Halicephalobus sp. NKZ332]